MKQVDALSWVKMNVFHWHITDSQSWSLEIKKHPRMTNDAYSPREIYTQKDIQALVRYGRERRVRVIPEIALPGHSASGWLQVDKQAVACAQSCLINDVYYEVANLFMDNIPMLARMNSRPIASTTLPLPWISSTSVLALPIYMDKPERRIMIWEDIVLSHDIPAKSLSSSVILQSWNDGTHNIKKLAQKGYDIVVSSADFSIWTAVMVVVVGYDFTNGLTDEEAKHILGAEAAVWSEQTDVLSVESKVWPRTAALVWKSQQGRMEAYN
ncbi:MAG: glycoside hydrolase superfamily [Benniella sp.]|nr:MAG: glycoside hydrolase superfamily [Benniella sp.]